MRTRSNLMTASLAIRTYTLLFETTKTAGMPFEIHNGLRISTTGLFRQNSEEERVNILLANGFYTF